MTAQSGAEVAAVLAVRDFTRFATIAVIGGCRGHLLRVVLDATPSDQQDKGIPASPSLPVGFGLSAGGGRERLQARNAQQVEAVVIGRSGFRCVHHDPNLVTNPDHPGFAFPAVAYGSSKAAVSALTVQ